VEELPRLEVDDDEDVVAAEREVADFDEVTGPDAGFLLTEEGGPTLTLWRRAAGLAHVPLDGFLGDGDTKLEEFTADALGAPAREMWNCTFSSLGLPAYRG